VRTDFPARPRRGLRLAHVSPVTGRRVRRLGGGARDRYCLLLSPVRWWWSASARTDGLGILLHEKSARVSQKKNRENFFGHVSEW